MIKPVYVYGSPVLRKVSTEITSDYPNLKELIESMFETMDGSEGVGLAAPQIAVSYTHLEYTFISYCSRFNKRTGF